MRRRRPDSRDDAGHYNFNYNRLHFEYYSGDKIHLDGRGCWEEDGTDEEAERGASGQEATKRSQLDSRLAI